MQVDAPAGELREHGVVGEPQHVGHLPTARVDGDGVLLLGPAALHLLHDVRRRRVGRRHDLHRVAEALGPRRRQDLVEPDTVRGVARLPCGGAMAGVFPPSRRRHRRGGLAQRGPQLVDARPGVGRPGQAGRREEEKAGRRPRPDAAVQCEGAAPPAGPPKLAQRPAAGEPQHQPAGRDHPQPAGRQLAVQPARFPEVQIPVELVDPGPQRQRAGRAVLFEGAAHLRGVRVDEDSERVALVDARDAGQQHPRRRAGLG